MGATLNHNERSHFINCYVKRLKTTVSQYKTEFSIGLMLGTTVNKRIFTQPANITYDKHFVNAHFKMYV